MSVPVVFFAGATFGTAVAFLGSWWMDRRDRW